MIDNAKRKKILNELCFDVGSQFHKARVSNNKNIIDVSEELNRTIKTIDGIESGKIKNLEVNFLSFLAAYYNKKIKIELIDI